MVLIIVAVPSSVLLAQIEGKQCTFGIGNGGLSREYGFAWLIAPSRSNIDAPGCLLLPVDGKLHRAGHAALVGLVEENRLQRCFGKVDVRCSFGDLDLGSLIGLVRRRGLHLKLRQGTGPLDGAPRPTQR